jgi:hypothetical protein
LFNLLPQGPPIQSLSQITKDKNNNFKKIKKIKKKFRNLPFAPTEAGVPVLGAPAAAVGLCSLAVGVGGSEQQVNKK